MSTMREMINFKSRTIYKLRYAVTGLQEGFGQWDHSDAA